MNNKAKKLNRKFKKQQAAQQDYLSSIRTIIHNPKKLKTTVLKKRERKRVESAADYQAAMDSEKK